MYFLFPCLLIPVFTAFIICVCKEQSQLYELKSGGTLSYVMFFPSNMSNVFFLLNHIDMPYMLHPTGFSSVEPSFLYVLFVPGFLQLLAGQTPLVRECIMATAVPHSVM